MAILALILVIGFGRLYWSARTGSEEFATSIHTLAGATVGTVWDLRTPAESHPDVQFDFWQSEIDRILEAHPDDAELHAAAAVMLDQPSLLYLSQLSRDVADSSESNSLFFSSAVFERLEEARRRFDEVGAEHSTALIRRATELEPDDPRWWRLRAVLMWPPPLSSQENQPRESDWVQVLEVAKQHDRDNALYSLLQAYWASEKAIDFDENANYVIGDPAAWNQTIEQSRDGVASSHLTLGEPAVAGVVRLHALSRHPVATTTESMRARFVASRAARLSGLLTRNLVSMADAKEISDEYEVREELLSLAEQMNDLARERSDKATRYDSLTVQLRVMVWQAKENLERERGDVSERTTAGLQDALWRQAAFQTAAAAFQQQKLSPVGAVGAAVSATALALFAATLAVALLLVAAWLACSRSVASLRLSVWPFALFGVGIVLSLLFLGAGPAGLISETVQHWILTGLSFAVLMSLFSAIAVRSRLRLRFSIRSLLIASAVAAVALKTAFHLQLGWSSVGLPIRVHAAPDSLLGIVQQQDAGSLDQWLPGPAWVSRLVLQWLMHHGPSWGVAIFVGLTCVAFPWRKSFANSVGQVLIASAILLLLWLNVWVWLEPTTYANARPTQMRYESYIRSVDEYYEPFEESLDRVLREQDPVSTPPPIAPTAP